MDGEDCTNSELLQTRHRQEKKDLQAKITAIRKNIPKNDKRRKKEAAEEISKLEEELDARHKHELNALNEAHAAVVSLNANDTTGESNHHETNSNDAGHDDVDSIQGEVRLTRAQRRRNKKENENKERNKRILEQEEINRSGPRVTELNSINKSLKELGLQIHNVPADGNCLYCSIKHQLEVTGRQSYKVPDLRKLTALFIKENKDEFLPFMYNDSEEPVDETQFEKYCNDVATTKLWGGQLELRAMSNVLKCPIKIIQAIGPPTIQGEQFDGEPLILTYHRHLYRLGEHYNSTMTQGTGEQEDDC